MISFSIASAQNHSKAEIANKEIITKAFHDWYNGTGNFFDLLADDMRWEITGSTPYSRVYSSKQEFLDSVIIPLIKN